ncbi:hypothetical protein U1Q18_012393 [Sarracenia purpurea var. burkii]
MDYAPNVRRNFPTASNFLHKARHDDGKDHRNNLQNPTGGTPERDYGVDNPSNAFVRRVLRPSRSHRHGRPERRHRHAENGDRNGSLRRSHGGGGARGNEETEAQSEHGIGDCAAEHILASPPVHSVGDIGHFHRRRNAAVLLRRGSGEYENDGNSSVHECFWGGELFECAANLHG